jgi:hypothetical protein
MHHYINDVKFIKISLKIPYQGVLFSLTTNGPRVMGKWIPKTTSMMTTMSEDTFKVLFLGFAEPGAAWILKVGSLNVSVEGTQPK